MRERLEYVAAWSALKIFGLPPRPAARWMAARFAGVLFRLDPGWRRAALLNMRLAFPESSRAERERTLKLMVRNLGWLLAEFAQLPRMTRGTVETVMVERGVENYVEAESRGRGVLFLTGHFGACAG
jgi:KDO2-lipid IV(A) lauroyltransferase